MVERLKKIYKSFSRVPLPQHLWDVDDMQQLSESIGSYIRERWIKWALPLIFNQGQLCVEITFIIIFTCGLEILFDGKTPKIKKFVLHEKRKGNQACPQCKNKYKRLKEGWNKGNHFGGSCQLVQSRSALE
ncbi:hypothetical protein DEO72_LG5g1434 [Vigna unguiculata]|uniref:Uncharacterized protein n=1 Tax=Vigna unguiculata TaxID=3917 RepID=A0A4D6LWE3_VIGUN|nr:hypothetical protein DEO72_LG5g1434 [Vigna unguiculata]